MPIFNRDEVYSREDNPVEFLLKCDSDAGCAQLLFTLDDWNDFDGGKFGHTLNICLIPQDEPWRWTDRLKLAWDMLVYGRIRYRDDMVIYRETVELLSAKFAEIAAKMPEVE